MTLFKLKLRKMVVCGFRQGIGDLPETCYYWEMHRERITDLSQQPIQTEMCKLLVQKRQSALSGKVGIYTDIFWLRHWCLQRKILEAKVFK